MKRLIEELKKIGEPVAAEYLEKEVLPKYPEDKFSDYEEVSDILSDRIIWSEAPQGNAFWKNIYNQLVTGLDE
jgi:hypothetical protein